ncbi:MAG: hypothetical protein GXY82_07570 [Methanospirillum sp.]|nr:hypothetical protein [Methanospirillum sp.]
MIRRFLLVALALLACAACVSASLPTGLPYPVTTVTLPAPGDETPPATGVPVATSAGNRLQVVSTTLDPPVLARGDVGTLTVEVANAGLSPLRPSRATLLSSGPVTVEDDPYPTVGEIGAGNRMAFTFTVKAGGPDGVAFPVFSLPVPGEHGLRVPVPVRVDSTAPAVSYVERPDVFSPGLAETVVLAIGNPRQTAIDGVMVTPRGTGFSATPSSSFIGGLPANARATAPFNLTIEQNATVAFELVWFNGHNRHVSTVDLPFVLGTSLREPDLILSNFEVERQPGGVFLLTGDITNAGLTPARSVVIAPGGASTPADPFPQYVVGSLEPDDFASFEVNFLAENQSSVPLVISYRDANGNPFESESRVALSQDQQKDTGSDSNNLPVIALALVLAAVIGYLIYRSWKR